MNFTVDVLECKDVHELQNAWTPSHFRQLLELIEYEDITSISDEDLKEMTALALSDLEPEEAAVAVLKIRFGDAMKPGQRQDLSADMQEGRIWEEFGNMAFHEELFNAACMLHWAFERKFPRPVCASVILRIKGLNPQSSHLLEHPTAAFLARVLNDGMDDHNAIYRLFHDELASESFREAEDIIWSFNSSGLNTAATIDVHLHTSWNWIDELKGVKQYPSTAFNDK